MRSAPILTLPPLVALVLLAPAGCREAGPENAVWQLVVLRGAPVQADAGGRAPTLRLDPTDRRVGGTTVCNGYSGPYTLAGDSLTFGALVSTKRACAEPEMNRQETAFLEALAVTRAWSVAGDTLRLHDGTGVVAQLRPR